ncbi:MAG: hypothetical protein FWD81_05725 [Methanomassiliicoccaceae archaeon]|nr:hypothetical protein [Methanomassiliicoccaceae archaeon]
MNMKLLKQKKNDVTREPTARSEDGLLFIDCRSCPSPSSFGDRECVRCVSGMMERNGTPARLIMRRESDVEYPESVITVISEISKIGSLTKATSSEKVPGRCKDCGSSIPKNAKDIWDSFPEPRFDIIRLEAERSNPNKDGCEECLWKTMGFIDRLDTMFSDLRKKAAKKAFRLTEV